MRIHASLAIAVSLLPALLVTPARAHHAFAAEFDAAKPVKFDGATVVKMEWVNPHSWIHVDVPTAGGKVERWAIEAGTPNVLFRRGFTKQSLATGTKIVVEGYRAKDGTHRANGRSLLPAHPATLNRGPGRARRSPTAAMRNLQPCAPSARPGPGWRRKRSFRSAKPARMWA